MLRSGLIRLVRRPILLLVALFAITVSAFSAVAQQSTTAPAVPKGTVVQGIRVSGYWTVEVRNADGSVAKHVEFENALTGTGAKHLIRLLTGTETSGLLNINADGTACAPYSCAILPPGSAKCAGLPRCWSTLTRSATDSAITLTGNITAPNDGTVTKVYTGIFLCEGTVAPSQCNAEVTNSFDTVTSYTLPTAVTVSAGQIVQFSVVLSFS